MTLPMVDPSMLWDRTLPKPTGLLQNISHDPFSSSRGSSLLQHRIVSDTFSRNLIDSAGRRSTVPCIAYQQRPTSPRNLEQVLDPRITGIGCGIGPNHLMSKRSASQMAKESRSSEPSPSSSSPAGQFCLCQPEAKIPRPRNAFILYRQHQQAAVVAQNPGLPNPDISKIIGEQWRSLAVKTKNEWKALAEEEKARHQQQYPDYRYQPRRNGRYSNTSSISGPSSAGTVGPEGNCLKCGGKMMNAPSTPYTPYTPVTPGLPQMASLPPPSRRHYTLAAPQQNGRPKLQQRVMSPQSARIRPYAEVFTRPAPVDPRIRYTSAPQAQAPMILDSPDPKRRRFNGNGVLAPTQGQMYVEPAYQYSPRRPEPAQQRTTMAPPSRSIYFQAPPPQLLPVHPTHPQGRRDPSLTLPPLKTTTVEPANAQSQKSGLEAMIMSIPVLNKVKILSQISPHLAAPGIVTPDHEVRGAIIAVEGIDPTSVFSMTYSLAEQLEKEGTFAVRIFGGPDPYESAREGSETMTTETFLKVISEWHKISREMARYITTRPGSQDDGQMESLQPSQHRAASDSGVLQKPHQDNRTMTTTLNAVAVGSPVCTTTGWAAPPPAEPKSPTSAVSPGTLTQAADLTLASPQPNGTTYSLANSNTEPPVTPDLTPSRRPSISSLISTPTFSALHPPHHSSPRTKISPDAIPIAIVPHYQLTTVDAASIAMPITDAYSPLSHWQWLATLWRGCVGPDVTVVMESPESEAESLPARNGNGAVAEKERQPQQVEVRLLEWRSVIVRSSASDGKEPGEQRDGGGAGGAGLGAAADSDTWEKAKRRVGFEVEEFLRK